MRRRFRNLALLCLAPVAGLACAPTPAAGPVTRRSPGTPARTDRAIAARTKAPTPAEDDDPAIPADAWPGAMDGRPAIGAESSETALPPADYDRLTTGRVALGPNSPIPPPTRRPSPANLNDVARELIEGHNREQHKAGLPPLNANSVLMAAAQAHAEDMAARSRMSHVGSDGSQPFERAARLGYQGSNFAENVAAGFRDVPEAIRGWMNSRGHRANITGGFNEIGVGYATDDKGVPYWCATFGQGWAILDPDEAEAAVVGLINHARADQGLPPLQVHPILSGVARRHAYAMSLRRKLIDRDDIGMHPLERARRLGYPFAASGVTSGSGQADAERLVRDWLSQPKSRGYLLGEYAEVGVGYAPDMAGTPFWSLMVGTPGGP